MMTLELSKDWSPLRYPSIDEMWEAELKGNSHFRINNHIGSRQRWYEIGSNYWKVEYITM